MSKTNKEKLPDLNRVPFKTRVRPYLIVAPSLIITIGIMVPFVMAIWYSLTNFSFKLPAHKFIGLTNWVNVLSSGSTWKAIWVTLLYGVASTAVEMALGMGVAMLLNSLNNRFSKIMRVVLIFPLMVAPVTATIVWQLMLNSSAGIVEKLLNVFNVYNFPWASSPKTAMMTVVLIDVWVNTAFVILLVLAGLGWTCTRVDMGYICGCIALVAGVLKYRNIIQFNSLTVQRFRNTYKDEMDLNKYNKYVDSHF